MDNMLQFKFNIQLFFYYKPNNYIFWPKMIACGLANTGIVMGGIFEITTLLEILIYMVIL